MSLLMDALKKAEEAKRLASEGNSPGTTPAATPEWTELTLKPMTPPATPPNSPLPDLSLHIDSVDADLAAVSTEAPARRRAPASTSRPSDASHREAAERIAIRNVFSAKQAPRSRSGLWLFLGMGAIAALGLGGYFWWQLQSVSGGSLARPVQALATAQPMPTAPTQGLVLAAAETVNPLPETLTPPGSSALRDRPEPAPSIARAARPQRPSAAVAQTEADSPVRLSRSQPKSSQPIERAYDALQAGKLDEAQRGYEQVLRSDANNTDAFLGLATIAAQQGQSERAQAMYLRALESDPSDATAQAGLINLRGQADPGLSESRLKTALSSQPDSSALHFALGNLYARQARWSEAQQAYFRAYSSEPDNADFIFNLAVSLDHLHQNKLAAQYYQMALNAAETYSNSRNTAFDQNQVKKRVLELQP